MSERKKIGIVGLGLIGGSIALSLAGKHTVVGMSANAADIDYALKNNIISKAAYSYKQLFGCDVIFVCTPLDIVRSTVENIYKEVGDSAVITDVGSVKGMLAGAKGRIVGGHPMAGTEKSGILAAKNRLFENAYYILCNYDATAKDVNIVADIVKDMGAIAVEMTADAHDKLIAKISHLPHMLAYSLVSAALDGDEQIVGSGFTDTTRIASSSPEFWNTVAKLNRKNLLEEMDNFLEVFGGLRQKIADGQDITDALKSAKNKRDKVVYAKRYMTEYILYIDVADRVGAIARTVALLADNGISIDNLQVMNSREGVGGALRIEFKDETSYMQAKEILK